MHGFQFSVGMVFRRAWQSGAAFQKGHLLVPGGQVLLLHDGDLLRCHGAAVVPQRQYGAAKLPQQPGGGRVIHLGVV